MDKLLNSKLSSAISDKPGATKYNVGASQPASVVQQTNVKDLSVAPSGFRRIQKAPSGVHEIAKKLLGGDFGKTTPFEHNGIKYLARVEHHYHPPGYKKGPTGWHKGVSVYQADEIPQSTQIALNQSNKTQSGRIQFLQRIENFLNKITG